MNRNIFIIINFFDVIVFEGYCGIKRSHRQTILHHDIRQSVTSINI